MSVDWAGAQGTASFLGVGIAAGAFVGWVMGPGRGPTFLARAVSRAALVVMAALLAATLAPSGGLVLVGRATLAVALGLLCGGFTQTLATAWSARGVREGGGHGRALVLASLLCLFLWALALFAVPLLALG